MADKLPSPFYCSICHKLFDSALNAPKFLNCHHKICRSCCDNMLKRGSISCPFCRSVTCIMGGETEVAPVSRLRTDHELLSLMHIFQSMKKNFVVEKSRECPQQSNLSKRVHPSSETGWKYHGTFNKNLFLTSVANELEFPLITEHSSMKKAGLGLRNGISFRESASSAEVKDVFIKVFPRLVEIKHFYVCTWMPGNSFQLVVEYYDVPSAHALKMITDKLIVLVPVKLSLPYNVEEKETVICEKCRQVMNVRLLAQHVLSECYNPREGCSEGPCQ